MASCLAVATPLPDRRAAMDSRKPSQHVRTRSAGRVPWRLSENSAYSQTSGTKGNVVEHADKAESEAVGEGEEDEHKRNAPVIPP